MICIIAKLSSKFLGIDRKGDIKDNEAGKCVSSHENNEDMDANHENYISFNPIKHLSNNIFKFVKKYNINVHYGNCCYGHSTFQNPHRKQSNNVKL